MALGYEFAPIDVSIMTHPKAFAAGIEAMGLWLWGMAFAKQHRTGGRVHRPAVLGAWGGRRNIMLAKRLEDAGLWTVREDGDWDIHNFEKKGPGATSTSRVQKHRQNKRSAPSSETDETLSETDRNGDLKRSASSSVSVSVSVSSPEGEREREPPAPYPDIGTPTKLPAWFSAALETVATQTGETLRPPDSWLRYSGHRAGKGRPPGQQDAVYWLTTVMVPEARKERQEAARQRERDAKFDRQRAGPGTTTETLVDTPEEQAERAERLRRQAAERKAARERGAA